MPKTQFLPDYIPTEGIPTENQEFDEDEINFLATRGLVKDYHERERKKTTHVLNSVSRNMHRESLYYGLLYLNHSHDYKIKLLSITGNRPDASIVYFLLMNYSSAEITLAANVAYQDGRLPYYKDGKKCSYMAKKGDVKFDENTLRITGAAYGGNPKYVNHPVKALNIFGGASIALRAILHNLKIDISSFVSGIAKGKRLNAILFQIDGIRTLTIFNEQQFSIRRNISVTYQPSMLPDNRILLPSILGGSPVEIHQESDKSKVIRPFVATGLNVLKISSSGIQTKDYITGSICVGNFNKYLPDGVLIFFNRDKDTARYTKWENGSLVLVSTFYQNHKFKFDSTEVADFNEFFKSHIYKLIEACQLVTDEDYSKFNDKNAFDHWCLQKIGLSQTSTQRSTANGKNTASQTVSSTTSRVNAKLTNSHSSIYPPADIEPAPARSEPYQPYTSSYQPLIETSNSSAYEEYIRKAEANEAMEQVYIDERRDDDRYMERQHRKLKDNPDKEEHYKSKIHDAEKNYFEKHGEYPDTPSGCRLS